MYLYIVVLFFVYLIKIVGEMRVKSNKYLHVPIRALAEKILIV